MEIAIIGGGFTGLTAAFELSKHGHKVTVFEKEQTIGGLAGGYIQPNWEWHLEYGYHHLFTNDDAIIALIAELGLSHILINKRPVTATYIHNTICQLDSPTNLLTFPYLSVSDKARTAFLLAFCKLNPFWRPLESITAKQFCMTIGGKRAWETIWEPLMIGKFGTLAPTVSAAWLWARIKKRTSSLYYIEGGFHTLIDTLVKTITKNSGKILTDTPVASLKDMPFDKILITVPTSFAKKLVPNLDIQIPHLHAQTLILETKEPILKDTYWLNITDRTFPFLAVVAHTNMIDKKHYGGNHITYFGNYLPEGHPYLSMTADQLYKKFLPFIQRLSMTANGKMKTANFPQKRLPFTVYRLHSFTAPYAQPVHQLHYSSIAPKLETPIPNLYLANLDSIFPWDRGTNYAVKLGKRAALAML